jgi:hypothetical protein
VTAEQPGLPAFVRRFVVRVRYLAVALLDYLAQPFLVEAQPEVSELFLVLEPGQPVLVAVEALPAVSELFAVLEPDQLAPVVAAVVVELSPDLARYSELEVVQPSASVQLAPAVQPVRPEFWVVRLSRVVQRAFGVWPGRAVVQVGFQAAVAAALHAGDDQHHRFDSDQVRVDSSALDRRQCFVVRP